MLAKYFLWIPLRDTVSQMHYMHTVQYFIYPFGLELQQPNTENDNMWLLKSIRLFICAILWSMCFNSVVARWIDMENSKRFRRIAAESRRVNEVNDYMQQKKERTEFKHIIRRRLRWDRHIL